MNYLVIFSFFVLIFMTYFNWSRNKNIVFLAILLTGINLWATLHYWLVNDFNEQLVAIFFNHFTPIYLLIGPSLYFYLRGVIKDDFIWKKTDLIHLIPATVQLILILPYTFGYSYDEKVYLIADIQNNASDYLTTYFNLVFNAVQTEAIRIGSFSIYLIFSFSVLIKYIIRSARSAIINIQRHIILRWLIYLHVSLFLILGLYIYLLNQSYIDVNFAIKPESYKVQNSLAFLISINNLSLLLIPEILFGLIIPKRPSNSVNFGSDLEDKDRQKPPLKDIEYLTELSDRIDQIMSQEQPFLKSDFKLTHLADALNVPEHHLASCLRNIKETTFTDLKNLYRINAFKDRIDNDALKNLTIDALSSECGFHSKSSFYSVFHKHEGMTPMEYLSKK